MEKKFKAGDIAYVSVEVCEDKPADWDYNVLVSDKGGGSLKFCVNECELFSVADFGTSNNIDWQAKYNEYNEKAEAKIRELANKLNDMAESLREAQAKAVSLNASLKEVGTTNADLVIKNAVLTKTNSELEEKLSSGKSDVEYWRTKYMNMKKSRNEYKRAADHLKEERDRADDELALTRIMNVALAEKIERMQNG